MIDRLEDLAAGLGVDVSDIFEYQPRSHERIADELRADIRGGRLGPGKLLPDVAELWERHKDDEEYRVSSSSLRNAIKILCGEGLVCTRGDGKASVAVKGDRKIVFIDESEPCEVSVRIPSPEEASKLELNRGVAVFTVSRPGKQIELYPCDSTILRYSGAGVEASQSYERPTGPRGAIDSTA